MLSNIKDGNCSFPSRPSAESDTISPQTAILILFRFLSLNLAPFALATASTILLTGSQSPLAFVAAMAALP
jgi:hypothetical protein